MPATIAVTLPAGVLDADEVCHRDAVVRPLRGQDEEWVAGRPRELPQAVLVPRLLRRCVVRVGGRRPDGALLRELTTGDRDALVVAVHAATYGDRVQLVWRCGACGSAMDVDFSLAALPVAERPQRPRYSVPAPDGGTVVVRSPRVGDLEALATAATDDLLALLRDRVLVTADAVCDDAAWRAVDDELARHHATPATDIEAVCPECGASATTAFEPVPWLLDEVLSRHDELERDVHLLSLHYHWALQEILALPRPRRRRYVTRLLAALDAVHVAG